MNDIFKVIDNANPACDYSWENRKHPVAEVSKMTVLAKTAKPAADDINQPTFTSLPVAIIAALLHL